MKKNTFFVHQIILSSLEKQVTNDIPVITGSGIMERGNVSFVTIVYVGTSFDEHMNRGEMTLKRGKKKKKKKKN